MTALEMNPEIRARWVAALRSGEYEQGTNRLRQGDQFCCLGVLCDLAERENVVQATADGNLNFSYGEDTDYLPSAVQAWAALSHWNPSVHVAGVDGLSRSCLSLLNDDWRWDFARIADAIEGAP